MSTEAKTYEVVAQANLPDNVKVPYRTCAGFSWSRTDLTAATLTEVQFEELKADKHILISTVDGKAFAKEKEREIVKAIRSEAGFQADAAKALDAKDHEIRGLTSRLTELESIVREFQSQLGTTPKPAVAQPAKAPARA